LKVESEAQPLWNEYILIASNSIRYFNQILKAFIAKQNYIN